MNVETESTVRKVHVYGLYIDDEDELPMDRSALKPHKVTSDTPGIRYFCVSREIGGNVPAKSAVVNCLTQYGIFTGDVVEFQNVRIEKKRRLSIER